MSSLTAMVCAQQTSPQGYPENSQTTGVDCSDPMQASSAECSNPGTPGYSGQGTIPPVGLRSGYGAPALTPGASYTDVEQMSRQAGLPARTVLPPQPLTEFQKFVASTSGQVLPIFGADLFHGVPSTFAPLNMTPAPPNYVIGPGDELRVRVWGQVNLQANLRVDRSGEIYLPQVGPVHVAGIPFSGLETHLRQAIGRVYKNFDLTADVGQTRSIQVYVTGEALRPGVYTVSSLSTLLNAVFSSGGPSVEGSMRDIELKRDGQIVTTFDLYDLLVHGDKSRDAALLPGDVIFIPPVGAEAALTGSVRTPAIYELRAGETLDELIADAGGVSTVAAQARVSIERITDHRDRQAMEVPYDATGLRAPLKDGDLVYVFPILPQYQKTVTLRGNIANPGRFAWHPGMRVSDLIPDKDSLITRNYWWRRAQLGLPAPEFESTPPAAAMQGSQQLTAQQRGNNSSLAAQGVALSGNMPPPVERTTVRQIAPQIDWSYAVIQRMDPKTLKTTLIPFDLGKLVLDHDSSQDIELQPGDVISIFSQSDIHVPVEQQPKLVTLSGEFVHAGVYSVQPGETFRHLVERAGGLTPDAYLYGSEYTRESTRVLQQARIDEYIQNLSMQIQRSNMAVAASAAGSQNLSTAAMAQTSEQTMLNRLQQIRATGRIVLRFKPDSSGIDSLPDIAMENGDHFIVPPVPATVNVVGAVYDQNSFLYVKGRKVGAYMRLAGGPTRDADRKQEFLMRADGEVVSYNLGKGLWSDNFDSLRVLPGDTVMVPEKMFKPSALMGLIQYSSLFSNFALGAVALTLIQ